jgi:hypothetical protein
MASWVEDAETAEINRIMRLSYDELCAEARARGEDPAEIVAKVGEIIGRAKADAHLRQKLRSR